jgi:hypothetical protein
MSLYTNGQQVTFKFLFNLDAEFYDPILIDADWAQRNTSATPFYGSTTRDILINVIRGENGGGGIVDGTFSYNAQSLVPDYGVPIATQFNTSPDLKTKLQNNYITRESKGIYNFVYTIPEKLFPGKYTIVLEAKIDGVREVRELYFQVRDVNSKKPIYIKSKQIQDNIVILATTSSHDLKAEELITIVDVDPVIDGIYQVHSILASDKFSVYKETEDVDLTNLSSTGLVLREKSNTPTLVTSQTIFSNSTQVNAIYKTLVPGRTNSVLLVGHADSTLLGLNEIRRINSLQEAIDIMSGNKNSPLLRAVFDCQAAGCTDIYIMISAPMSEYVEDQAMVNTKRPDLISNSSTPSSLTFYEKYYERLEKTYLNAREVDFIDIIVPVGVSFIRNDGVKFVRQLADHCDHVYKNTSAIRIGIIGSRSKGMNEEDVNTISSVDFLKNILKDSNGTLPEEIDVDGNNLDVGRYILLYYGEAVFNYPQLSFTYTNSISAAVAGQLSEWPVYMGLNRKVLKGAYSAFGVPLNAAHVAKLHSSKVNTLVKNNRSRRNIPFQILLSDDKTLAKDGSSFANVPQVRLAAMIINEIILIAESNIGKFAYDTIQEKVNGMFKVLKSTTPSIVRDYRFEIFADKKEKGKIYLEIDLISSHALKRISFNILTGPGV